MYKNLWEILDKHKCVPRLKRKGEMNMENTMKMYITADEVAELLGVSRGYIEYVELYKRLHLSSRLNDKICDFIGGGK